MRNLFFKKQGKVNKNGFSMLEVIFSIGIVSISLVSLVSLFTASLRAEIINKNKLIAIYLANESLEIVRQERDNIWFGGSGGSFVFIGIIKEGDVIVSLSDKNNIRKGWKLSSLDTTVNNQKVYLSGSSYFQYEEAPLSVPADNWSETGFERYLTIKNNDNNDIAGCFSVKDCVKITSHVSFKGTEIVELTTYLYDKWH